MQFSEEKENFSGVIIDLTKKIDNFWFTSVLLYNFFTFIVMALYFSGVLYLLTGRKGRMASLRIMEVENDDGEEKSILLVRSK
ncbi:hypothetical protein VNO80_16522 [Phaseolus coccineus]|uniref:Uncharacterized protein n=1 Tax=Phaseolus coccineus TaxID=3886 RepID=A0AAN9MRU7_PHACN